MSVNVGRKHRSLLNMAVGNTKQEIVLENGRCVLYAVLSIFNEIIETATLVHSTVRPVRLRTK